jgi:hypothetical protein
MTFTSTPARSVTITGSEIQVGIGRGSTEQGSR